MGGSWLGVLVVDDESTASYLASYGTDELTQEAYDRLKKKRQTEATAHGSVPSQTPRPPPQPMVGSASRAAVRSDSSSDAPGGAGADGTVGIAAGPGKTLASITLLTTTKQPPREPVLEMTAAKRRKAA